MVQVRGRSRPATVGIASATANQVLVHHLRHIVEQVDIFSMVQEEPVEVDAMRCIEI